MNLFLPLFLLITLFLNANPELLDSNSLLEKDEIEQFNEKLIKIRSDLEDRYLKVDSCESDEEYHCLLLEIKGLRERMYSLQNEWRSTFAHQDPFSEEGYALWDQGETTLPQLIMEYGSVDYLYVIPPELANMKLQIFSGIPIPRESWNEMLEIILSVNGIGSKRINPYAKQLYVLKHDPSKVEAVCMDPKDLARVSGSDRIFYVFSPEPEQIRAVQSFFERFSDPKETVVQVVGYKVILVSTCDSVEKLLSLYDAVWEKDTSKMIQVINLRKIDIPEAEKILKAFFPDPTSKMRTPIHSQLSDELVVLSIPQGLVLIGDPNAVDRAQKVLSDLEEQLNDPSEMTVYWYSCKHSNPEDISEVLEQVYDSLIQSDLEKKKKPSSEVNQPNLKQTKSQKSHPISVSSAESYGEKPKKTKGAEGNFIVDPKTGSILMVVRKDQLDKIKTLLKKIDVPKKMVQIDVLLVEKKIQDRSQTGLNILKLGSNVHKKQTSLSFDANDQGFRKGILDFIFSRKANHGLLGVDLTFSFLMAQTDIKINANPSVIAINQTPATISIVEEISINNGAVLIDTGSGNPKSEKSFTRAQYGTILKMTPTIHLPDEEEDDQIDARGFITLASDIEFDTTETSKSDRPPVTRRSIKNEVTVADGETIILGGLRRKTSETFEEKIPFLGDIPGIGKLFGTTAKTDHNTEMFIFITPRIIRNPIEDLRKLRRDELQKRAGDIPEFLARMQQAKTKEKQELFEKSLQLIFDAD